MREGGKERQIENRDRGERRGRGRYADMLREGDREERERRAHREEEEEEEEEQRERGQIKRYNGGQTTKHRQIDSDLTK